MPTSADQVFHRESGNYEEAGPPLPYRSYPTTSNEMVENSLYETIDPKHMDGPVEEECDSGERLLRDYLLRFYKTVFLGQVIRK